MVQDFSCVNDLLSSLGILRLLPHEVFITGGLIRDFVLQQKPPKWRDIDLFVTSKDGLTWIKESAASEGWTITSNSFGGCKARLGSLVFDFWMWEKGLDETDFGINAIAYDLREIIKHPRWIEDERKKVVEPLNRESPCLDLNQIRGLVLAMRLGYNLGPGFPRGHLNERQREYMEKKIDIGEWGPDVLKVCRQKGFLRCLSSLFQAE